MLEVKTIWAPVPQVDAFDTKVNEALAEGWELVRREIFPGWLGVEYSANPAFYAELERYTEPEEEEEPEDDDWAEWRITRNPALPYKCSNCGYSTVKQTWLCPTCTRQMKMVGGSHQ